MPTVEDLVDQAAAQSGLKPRAPSVEDLVDQHALASGLKPAPATGYVSPSGPRLANPEVAGAFRNLAAAAQAEGIEVRLNSGDRSPAEQQRLWANRGSNPNPVAPPGTSNHEKGLAADLSFFRNGQRLDPRYVIPLARQQGFEWFGPRDPVHFTYQPRPTTLAELHRQEGNLPPVLPPVGPAPPSPAVAAAVDRSMQAPKTLGELHAQEDNLPPVIPTAPFNSRTTGVVPPVSAPPRAPYRPQQPGDLPADPRHATVAPGPAQNALARPLVALPNGQTVSGADVANFALGAVAPTVAHVLNRGPLAGHSQDQTDMELAGAAIQDFSLLRAAGLVAKLAEGRFALTNAGKSWLAAQKVASPAKQALMRVFNPGGVVGAGLAGGLYGAALESGGNKPLGQKLGGIAQVAGGQIALHLGLGGIGELLRGGRPVPTAEIAQRTGEDPEIVAHQLAQWADQGQVVRTPKGWVAPEVAPERPVVPAGPEPLAARPSLPAEAAPTPAPPPPRFTVGQAVQARDFPDIQGLRVTAIHGKQIELAAPNGAKVTALPERLQPVVPDARAQSATIPPSAAAGQKPAMTGGPAPAEPTPGDAAELQHPEPRLAAQPAPKTVAELIQRGQSDPSVWRNHHEWAAEYAVASTRTAAAREANLTKGYQVVRRAGGYSVLLNGKDLGYGTMAPDTLYGWMGRIPDIGHLQHEADNWRQTLYEHGQSAPAASPEAPPPIAPAEPSVPPAAEAAPSPVKLWARLNSGKPLPGSEVPGSVESAVQEAFDQRKLFSPEDVQAVVEGHGAGAKAPALAPAEAKPAAAPESAPVAAPTEAAPAEATRIPAGHPEGGQFSQRATGLANQVQDQQLAAGYLERLPDKGEGVGAEEALQRGQEALRKGLDPEALARKVGAGGYVPNATEFGALLEHNRTLENRVNAARTALDEGLKANADAAPLQRDYEAAKAAHAEFLDHVAKGKTEASNSFRALQAGVELDTGDFAQVLAEARRVGGKPVSPEAEARLKQLTDEIAASKGRESRIQEAHAEQVAELQRQHEASIASLMEQGKAPPVSIEPNGTVRVRGRESLPPDLAEDVARFGEAFHAGDDYGMDRLLESWGEDRAAGVTRAFSELRDAGHLDEVTRLHRDWMAEQEAQAMERDRAALAPEMKGNDEALRDKLSASMRLVSRKIGGKRVRYYDIAGANLTAAEKERLTQLVSTPGRSERQWDTATGRHYLSGMIEENSLPYEVARYWDRRFQTERPAPKPRTPAESVRSRRLQVLKTEEAAIKDELARIASEALGKVHSVGSAVYDSARYGYSLGKLVLNKIRQGAPTLDEAIETALEHLRGLGLTATREDAVRDIWELTAKEKQPATAAQLEASRRGRLVSQAVREAGGRGPANEPARAIQRQQVKKPSAAATDRAKQAEDRRERQREALRLRVAGLESGEPPKAVGAAKPQDAELQRLRQKVRDLEKVYREQGAEPARTVNRFQKGQEKQAGVQPARTINQMQAREARSVAEARAQVDELKRQIRENDLKGLPKKAQSSPTEALRLLRGRRDLLKHQVQARIEAAKPMTTGGRIQKFIVESALVNPTLPATKMVGNAISAAAQGPVRLAEVGQDALAAKLRGRPREVYAAEVARGATAYLSALPNAARDALNVLRTGVSGYEAPGGEFEVPRREWGSSQPGVKSYLANPGTRNIQAVRALFLRPAVEGELAAQATRAALKEGATGPAFQARFEHWLQNPTPEMLKAAERQASVMTFHGDTLKGETPGFGGAMIRRFEGWANTPLPENARVPWLRTVRPLRFAAPFLRTTFEIAVQGSKYTPVGLADLPVNAGTAGARTSAAKAMVGATAALPFALLAAQGQLTGGAPKNASEKAEWARYNIQPYSIYEPVSKRWISYAHSGIPTMGLAQIAEAAAEYRRTGNAPAPEKVKALLAGFTAGTGEGFWRASAFSAASRILDAIHDPGKDGARLAQSLAQAPVPGAGALRTAVEVSDETTRAPENPLDSVKALIPGLEQQVPPRRAGTGRNAPIVKHAAGIAALSPLDISLPSRPAPAPRQPKKRRAFYAPKF